MSFSLILAAPEAGVLGAQPYDRTLPLKGEPVGMAIRPTASIEQPMSVWRVFAQFAPQAQSIGVYF
jgi:hypothetical protein